MTAQTLECRLRGYADAPSTARVEVLRLDGADRLRRSVTHVGMCWGATLVSAFIPVAHLFLVPGFFIAGAVVGVRDLTVDRIVRHASGTCPDCGAEQTLDLSGRWRGWAEIACRSCQRMLRLDCVE